MIDATTPAEDRLIELITAASRGPKRDGLFALWLVIRAAEGLLGRAPLDARSHRRRLQALEGRMATLTIPPPLRRALNAAQIQLDPATPECAAVVLSQLVAPARDVLGNEAADAVALAARNAREKAA
ncbi:MAG TPA: hypothetical protein VLT79_08245 [Gemmatimonadales bacterium]|nr:hypothetical protein [Gemmatimonadales bacterium]